VVEQIVMASQFGNGGGRLFLTNSGSFTSLGMVLSPLNRESMTFNSDMPF